MSNKIASVVVTYNRKQLQRRTPKDFAFNPPIEYVQKEEK